MKEDALVKSRLTGPAAGTGVQCFYNYLKLLDSGFRRNDDHEAFPTFYDFIKEGKEMKMQEVRAKAKTLGIKNTFGLTKEELIRRVQKAEGYFDCFGTANEYCDQFQCCFRDDCFRFVKD